jgi:type I restriction enzyme S subunit
MSRVRFGDVVREVKAQVDRSNNPYEYYVAGDHMDTEELRILRRGNFSEPPEPGPAFIRVFRSGQILYGSRRTYLKKVAVADFEGVCANTTFVLETKDHNVFLQQLLPFLIYSERFTQYSINNSKGSTNPYILFSDLAKYEFDLPSIDKQQILAEILWAAINTRNAYKELLARTEHLVKSQFIEMFGAWDELARWPCKLIDDIAGVTVGVVIKPAQYYTDLSNGIRAFRSLNVGERHVRDDDWVYFTPEGHKANKKSELKAGDVLVVRSGYPGTSCVVTDSYAGSNAIDIIIARPDTSVINSIYLCAFTNFPHGNNQIRTKIGGAAQQHFNIGAYRDMTIAIPPLFLQNRFAAFVAQADKSKFAARRQAGIVSLLCYGIHETTGRRHNVL